VPRAVRQAGGLPMSRRIARPAGGDDWAFVAPRLLGLAVLAVLATAWATRTFRSYQRSI
jgi:hypothetical protein